jgi:hypothetical protein
MNPSEARLHPLGGIEDETVPGPWDGAESRWVVASCLTAVDHSGGVPNELCTCGFYSVRTLPLLLQLLSVFAGLESGPESGLILGRVELAGKIIEHDLGYRAERARVAELIPHEDNLTNASRLANLLGLRLGDPVPSNIRPPPRWFPPNGPSSLRLRVRDWVQDAAA